MRYKKDFPFLFFTTEPVRRGQIALWLTMILVFIGIFLGTLAGLGSTLFQIVLAVLAYTAGFFICRSDTDETLPVSLSLIASGYVYGFLIQFLIHLF